MQLNHAELQRARAALDEATDGRVRERLGWVVKAFEWALECPGRESPALAAARTDALDHDGDGKKGGSLPNKPRRKAGK